MTVALNHEQIKIHPERTSNITLFIDQYHWKKIIFPPEKKDWNEFQKNNETIALNILCVLYNTEEIRHAHKSKHNLNHENKVILLMITDDKKCHNLTVKNMSALLRRITSNNNGDFYCSNFLIHLGHILIQECKDHDYCYI